MRSYRLNLLVLTITAIAIVRVFVDFGQVYIIQRTGQKIFTRLREDLFRHFQNLPVGFFEGHRTGEIISRLTNDLTALGTLMNLGVTIAVGAPIELVGALGLMLHFNCEIVAFCVGYHAADGDSYQSRRAPHSSGRQRSAGAAS